MDRLIGKANKVVINSENTQVYSVIAYINYVYAHVKK